MLKPIYAATHTKSMVRRNISDCDEKCEAGRIIAERRKSPAAAGADLFAVAASSTPNALASSRRGSWISGGDET
jgi:hypothetical protein